MGNLGLGLLFLSYATTALSLAALFLRLGFPARSGGVAMLFAVPLAPAVQAWLLFALLSLKPLGSWPIMVGLVQLVTLIPLLLMPRMGLRVLRETWLALGEIARAFREGARRNPALGVICLALVVQAIVMTAGVATAAVVASDPLEYFAVARVIFADMSLAHYPIDPSLPESGLYARSAHPPSYHLMLVWTYVFQGDPMRSLFARLTQLIYAFSAIALVAYATARMTEPRHRYLTAFFAIAFVLSIGLFGLQVTSLHIDVMRITMYGTAFFAFAEFAARMSERRAAPLSLREDVVPAVVTGGFVGFGMFAHSIGILLLPCMGLAYFALVRRRFSVFLLLGVVLVAAATAVGSWQFVSNVIHFGVPVHDSEPVWELPGIDDARDVRYRRDLVTLSQRVWRGLLVWLTNGTLFGYVHWFVLIPGLFFVRALTRTPFGRVVTFGLLSFYFIAIVTMLLGMDLVIKNFRYMMTILPFVVPLAATSVGLSYVALKTKLLAR